MQSNLLTTKSSEADIKYVHDFLHFARFHTVNVNCKLKFPYISLAYPVVSQYFSQYSHNISHYSQIFYWGKVSDL